MKFKPNNLLARGTNGIRLLFIFTGTGLYLHFPGGALLEKQKDMQISEKLLGSLFIPEAYISPPTHTHPLPPPEQV